MSIKCIPLLIILMSPSLFAQEYQWEHEETKNDIKLYQRTVDDSPYKAFRGVTRLNIKESEIIDLLNDTKSLHKWLYYTSRVELIEKKSDFESYLYIINDLPWPFSDRDAIVKMSILVNEDSSMRAKISSTEDVSFQTPEKDLIRMNKLNLDVTAFPTSDDEVLVNYDGHFDLGDDFSSSVYHSIFLDVPFYTLQDLKKKLAEEP